MANTKSAKKRIVLNKKRRIQNNSHKSDIKTSTKQFLKLLKNFEKYDHQTIKLSLNILHSKIDKATKKNILHRNTGARKKAKFSKLFNRSLT